MLEFTLTITKKIYLIQQDQLTPYLAFWPWKLIKVDLESLLYDTIWAPHIENEYCWIADIAAILDIVWSLSANRDQTA